MDKILDGEIKKSGEASKAKYKIKGEEKNAVVQQYSLPITDEAKLLLKNASKVIRTVTDGFAETVEKDAAAEFKKHKTTDRYIGSVNIPNIGGYKITADRETEFRNPQTGEVVKSVGFSGTLKAGGSLVSKTNLGKHKEALAEFIDKL